MTSIYTKRLLEGETPTPEEWNDHLIAFHRQYEYATSGPMSIMRMSDGETSYHYLARRTHEVAPNAHAVLDVGCGEGLLLRRLSQLYGDDVELHGIDLSESEIERARGISPVATFRCGDARTADLGVEAYDVVVSHLVLMIATQPERILRSMHRALKPNGTMLALVQGVPAHTALSMLVMAAVGALKNAYPSFMPTIPDRVNFEDDVQVHALLAGSGFREMESEALSVGGRFTRVEAWAFVQRIYFYGLLPSALLDAMHQAVDSALTDMLDADGRVELALPLRTIIARA